MEVISRSPIVTTPDAAAIAATAFGYCWMRSEPAKSASVPAANCRAPKMLVLLYQTFLAFSDTAHPTTQRTAQSEAAVSFVEFCEHLGTSKITERSGLSSRMRSLLHSICFRIAPILAGISTMFPPDFVSRFVSLAGSCVFTDAESASNVFRNL